MILKNEVCLFFCNVMKLMCFVWFSYFNLSGLIRDFCVCYEKIIGFGCYCGDEMEGSEFVI